MRSSHQKVLQGLGKNLQMCESSDLNSLLSLLKVTVRKSKKSGGSKQRERETLTSTPSSPVYPQRVTLQPGTPNTVAKVDVMKVSLLRSIHSNRISFQNHSSGQASYINTFHSAWFLCQIKPRNTKLPK